MKSKKRYLVTGGTGFIGSALVKRLVEEGNDVRVFDNDFRGNIRRINHIVQNIELIKGDIRNRKLVEDACEGIDCCCHLAYVNGTEHFYKMPEFVLDVAIKGVMNVLDGCMLHNVPELIMASSSEVYQNASTVPTDENVSLVVPDVFNPRYSYGGGKILSELVAVNYGRKYFKRAAIFRPHNVYGPDMGWEHVIPQFVIRMKDLCRATSDIVKFPIQGSGEETRAFVYIDDFTNGLMKVIEQGEHLNVYHIGTDEEVSIGQLAKDVAVCFEREIEILPGVTMKGSALRRCPDISKLRKLGYKPKVGIKDGLRLTAEWYIENSNLKP